MSDLRNLLTSLVLLSLIFTGGAGAQELKISHLYDLADFSGTVPYSDVNLFADRERDETYAFMRNSVRLFNGVGMEIYRYDHDAAYGAIYDLAVDSEGDIFKLVYLKPGTAEATWQILRCDYRGRVVGSIEVDTLPAEIEDFGPNHMFFQNDEFLLVSRSQLLAVVLDSEGSFLRSHDFAQLLNLEDPQRSEIFGFSLDSSGDMLFTIPTEFKAYVVSPDGTVLQFGSPGSAPGKFGIVSGIARDDAGRIFVADKLRWVVMVFDHNFQLITEFGNESGRRNLVRPTDLTIGSNNRLYVTQARREGVKVFGLLALNRAPVSPEAGENIVSRLNPGTEPASDSVRPAQIN